MSPRKPLPSAESRFSRAKATMMRNLLERTGLDRKPPETHATHRPRVDEVTAQQVDVAIVFLSMLGYADAVDYLTRVGMREDIAHRVLEQPACRRGVYDENGLRIDSAGR